METIAHMVDEVCKKVGTRNFPPWTKRDEEDMALHPHPSTITERSHEPTKSTVDEEEGIKTKDSSNPSTCSSIMRFFGFSSRRVSTSDDHNIIQDG